MRPIQADFLERTPVRPALGYALAASLVLLALAELRLAIGWQQPVLDAERRVAQHRLIDDSRTPLTDFGSVAQPDPAYARDAAAVLQMAEYDVAQVLTTLETVQVAGVRVLALEIASSERSASVELEFQDPDTLHEYLEQLNAGLEAAQRWQLRRTQVQSANVAGTATIIASPALVGRPSAPVFATIPTGR